MKNQFLRSLILLSVLQLSFYPIQRISAQAGEGPYSDCDDWPEPPYEICSSYAGLTVHECESITLYAFCCGEPSEAGYFYTYTWQQYSTTGGWLNVPGGNSISLTLTSVSPSIPSKKYRCTVAKWRSSPIGVVSSWNTGETTVSFDFKTPLLGGSSRMPPADQDPCLGDPVTFTISLDEGYNCNFQWRKSPNESSWSSISGETSNTLSFNASEGDDGYYYLCRISNACGTINEPDPEFHLNVIIPPEVTGQSGNLTVCQDEIAEFQVTANGTDLNYQWFHNGTQIPGADSYSYTNYNVQLGDSGNYYCRVWNDCGTVSSQIRILTVNTLLTINPHPVDDEVCEGETTSFNVIANGSIPITYQWQVSDDGGNSWDDITGETSSTLQFAASGNQNGNKYRCLASNPCAGDIESGIATLTVNLLPVINTEPDALIKCTGQTGTLSMSATGTALMYQWYKNDLPIPGANEANYVNNNLQTDDAGTYYCRVHNMCDTIFSRSVEIIINTPVSITTHPVDKQECEGTSIIFEVSASGTLPFEYQWQKSIDGGSSWGNISGEIGELLEFEAESGQGGYRYKCLVSNSCASFVSSDPATLTVDLLPNISSSPENKYICIDGNTSFSTSASGTGIQYQWQVSKDQSATWINLISTGVYSNTNTPTMDITAAPDSMNGYLYRCMIAGDCGNPIYTDTAELVIQSSPEIVTHPMDTSVCEGETVTFFVEVKGQEPIEYRWYEGGAAVTDWISDDFYTIDPVTTSHNVYFKVTVRNECSMAGINSDDALLTVHPKPTVSLGADRHLCTGESTVINAGFGYESYSWDNGETTQSIEVSEQGSYRVTVYDANGCTNQDNIYIVLDPQLPPVDLGKDASFCPDQLVVLDAGAGFDTYSWSIGSNQQSITPINTGQYYVTASRNNTVCESTDTVNILFAEPFDGETLCLVTIDVTTGKNLLVWEKTPDAGIEYYNLYRESTSANQYDLMETVPVSSLSVYRDEVADPESRPYKYKITAMDTCGNENPIEDNPYHRPIFLQWNSSVDGVNLSWKEYQIEGKEISFKTYEIYRGADSSALSQISEVPGGTEVFSDKDPNALKYRYYYRVAGVLDEPCLPTGTKSEINDFSRVKSNLENNRVVPPDNYAPTDIQLSETSIDENNAEDDLIGRFIAEDPDTSDTHIFILVPEEGSSDHESFHISGDSLLCLAEFDFETQDNYSIRVRCIDNGLDSLTFEKSFTISINDVTETGFRDVYVTNLNIYPNPFKNITTIEFTNPDRNKYILYVTDLSGKVVHIEDNIFSDHIEFNRNQLPHGVYFVELRGPKIHRGKMVVE